ncbi:hypothetical protein EDD11_010466 [Mortierella claussenii]|nr:hypothetical protein EDD11_010466 [Mortierella claussenii]
MSAGICSYNQGTEEATTKPSRSMHPSPSTGRSLPRVQNHAAHSKPSVAVEDSTEAATTATTATTATAATAAVGTRIHLGTTSINIDTHSSTSCSVGQDLPLPVPSVASVPKSRPTMPSSFMRSNVASSPSIAASARNKGDSEESSASATPSPSSSSSSSPSSSSTPSSSSPAGNSDSVTKKRSTAYVGAGTSTSALLFSTSQEFGHIWDQTTAFLHRTFSPTYRVGHLYLESWTNGTQKRGLERLRTNILRGDVFLLVKNMTVQLRDRFKQAIAEAAAMDRQLTRALEETERGRHDHGKQGSGNSHNDGRNSSSGTTGGGSSNSSGGSRT